MEEKIVHLIYESLKLLNEDLQDSSLENPMPGTRLYGNNSPLDSLALVSLIADLEMDVSEEFGKEIVLADERAMSRHASPFRTVASLADYIQQLIDEA